MMGIQDAWMSDKRVDLLPIIAYLMMFACQLCAMQPL